MVRHLTPSATERFRAEEQRTVLINELNHRVKNTLATVQAIATQTLRGTGADPTLQERLEARLIALSDAHDILTQENWEGAEIRQVVSKALLPHASSERMKVKGLTMRLSPKAAVAVAMGIHELATNAAKYGALSNGTGLIDLRWEVNKAKLITWKLTWREIDGPTVTEPERKGFGSRLIERNLAHDLDGEATVEYRQDGVVCTIVGQLELVGAQI